MKIYLDTSSLVKLYHYETGTNELDNLLENNSVQKIFLSEVTKIEFDSAIWNKVRTKDLTFDEAMMIIKSFESDYAKYSFVDLNSDLILQAKNFIAKYGIQGLRTLDSIQLASIVFLKSELNLSVTADKILGDLINLEGIRTL